MKQACGNGMYVANIGGAIFTTLFKFPSLGEDPSQRDLLLDPPRRIPVPEEDAEESHTPKSCGKSSFDRVFMHYLGRSKPGKPFSARAMAAGMLA